jgi:hypothetical protein
MRANRQSIERRIDVLPFSEKKLPPRRAILGFDHGNRQTGSVVRYGTNPGSVRFVNDSWVWVRKLFHGISAFAVGGG